VPQTFRVGLTILAGIGLLAVFVVADGEGVHGAGWAALPLALWWLLPFAMGTFASRSFVGALLIDGVVSIAIAAGLIAIYSSESSTAAIGLFTLPALAVGLALAGLLIERIALGPSANSP